jgi:hypothetical protein
MFDAESLAAMDRLTYCGSWKHVEDLILPQLVEHVDTPHSLGEYRAADQYRVITDRGRHADRPC